MHTLNTEEINAQPKEVNQYPYRNVKCATCVLHINAAHMHSSYAHIQRLLGVYAACMPHLDIWPHARYKCRMRANSNVQYVCAWHVCRLHTLCLYVAVYIPPLCMHLSCYHRAHNAILHTLQYTCHLYKHPYLNLPVHMPHTCSGVLHYVQRSLYLLPRNLCMWHVCNSILNFGYVRLM